MEVYNENKILLNKMIKIENSKKVFPEPQRLQFYTSVNRLRSIKKTNIEN
jgi:hypothetical protein